MARIARRNSGGVATPKLRTLLKALETLGSEKALADALCVTPTVLASWLGGAATMPDAAYLSALEIVARGPFNGRKPT